ncbi:hypothetical protein O181_029887 [Austropuccinia psidii MF-1]|uniref:Uncharacterized protein n=1 Tax=Austropuccinia psidii MF-1 TaxID=1389203 RepID=A0A9Q3CXG6_9BASI|nr:hypothetical protein [Austropuccinia psidii MF-1]
MSIPSNVVGGLYRDFKIHDLALSSRVCVLFGFRRTYLLYVIFVVFGLLNRALVAENRMEVLFIHSVNRQLKHCIGPGWNLTVCRCDLLYAKCPLMISVSIGISFSWQKSSTADSSAMSNCVGTEWINTGKRAWDVMKKGSASDFKAFMTLPAIFSALSP